MEEQKLALWLSSRRCACENFQLARALVQHVNFLDAELELNGTS